MSTLRRTMLAIYSLLIMAACGGMIALAWVGLDIEDPAAGGDKLDINIGDFNLQAFVISDDLGRVIFTIVMGLVAAFGLVTLLLAFTRDVDPKSKGTLKLRQADGGYVEVPASTIEALLKSELEEQPTIRHATVHADVSGDEVDTFLMVGIAADANIAQATTEATETVARTLHSQVGVTKVRRPTVKIVYEDTPPGTIGGTAPPAAAPVYAPPPPPVYAAPPPAAPAAAPAPPPPAAPLVPPEPTAPEAAIPASEAPVEPSAPAAEPPAGEASDGNA